MQKLIAHIAILLSAQQLLVLAAAGSQSFEIRGLCHTESRKPSGESFISLDIPFDIKVADDTWSIRTEEAPLENPGRTNSFDYSEIVFDGTDLYQVDHLAIENNALPSKASLYGSVGHWSFPGRGSPLQKLLWLCFCTGSVPTITVSNFPPEDFSLQQTNIARVDFEYYGSSHLPKKMEVFVKGKLVRDAEHPAGIIITAPPPFEKGFRGFALISLGKTNIAGGFDLPISLEASYFYPPESGTKSNEMVIATRTTILVTNCDTSGVEVKLPALTGVADIIDSRFPRNGIPLTHYIDKPNSVWVSRHDVDPASALAGKTPAPVLGASYPNPARVQSKSKLALYIIVSIVLFPIVVFIATRRHSISIKPVNNKN